MTTVRHAGQPTGFFTTGEMGRLIQAKDWSQTPLGPMASWSPSLRTMVNFMLANRFPLLLWWGPEYISIYNDAYRPVLGAKHPLALGQSASECWQEIWHILQPLIDTPFHGGPATWNDDLFLELNRHGFVEETHFTIAYSPVPDDSVPSGIGGVLATVHEITEKVVGERRVVVLRDLGSRSAEAQTAEQACRNIADTLAAHAKDIPFALLYLIDADGKSARLVSSSGAVAEAASCAPLVDLRNGEGQLWPLADVVRSETLQVIDNLAGRFGSAVPPGPWSDAPRQAVLVPIRSNIVHQLAGVMIAGVSARLKLDDLYSSFYELLAGQIATAIANARAYEQEKQRAEALAEIDRAKTLFFSNVSHEFRTPLTLMLGPVEELLEKSYTELAPAAKGQLEIVHRNSLRLLKLVNTILDFSRIEAGRVRANYQRTDLAAYTAELASNFRSACERAGLSLTIDCPPAPADAAAAYVDRDMWEKIVLNLLSNAFKFTLDGGIEVKLEAVGSGEWRVGKEVVSGELRVGSPELTTNHAQLATLVVRDTGVGIPAEELPHIFDRFHRVRESRGRTHEGTGIGLALVRELAKLHGGTVRVNSDLGRGSTFYVSLPLGKAHLDPAHIGEAGAMVSTRTGAPAFVEEALRWLPDEVVSDTDALRDEWRVASEDGPSLIALPSPRATILVADDNADMRDYLRRLLSQTYGVVTVVDGAAALQAAREQSFDLVLTDVMMPRLDGFGLLRELRADSVLRSLPIILLSARAGEEARIDGAAAGADDYLVKPFSARELLARVDSQVRMAALRHDADRARRESEQRFRETANAAPAMLWVTETDGSCSFLSRGWYAFTGQSEEAGVGFGWQNVVHPDDRATSSQVFLEANRMQKPFALDYRLRRADGEYRWCIDAGQPRFDEQGNFLGYVGSVIDITDRKLAEDQLARDFEAMTHLQRLGTLFVRQGDLEPVLGKIVEAAIAIDKADFGNIQLLDRKSGTLRIAAQRGFAPWWVDFWNAVDTDRGACGTALGRGERVVVEDVEQSPIFVGTPALDIQLRAGVRAVQSTPLVSRSGQLLGMFSTHYRTVHRPDASALALLDLLAQQAADIISRAEVEVALREYAEQLRQADRSKDEFLATLAHELRNPLAPIRNAVALLKKPGLSKENFEFARDITESQIDIMVRLIDDLLDVSRISRNKIELKKERVELKGIIDRAIETALPHIEENGQRLTVELPKEKVWLTGDRVRLAQVFGNLLNNAAKYSENNGRITLRAEIAPILEFGFPSAGPLLNYSEPTSTGSLRADSHAEQEIAAAGIGQSKIQNPKSKI